MSGVDEVESIKHVIAQLAHQFPHLAADRVAEIVEHAYHELDGSPIRLRAGAGAAGRR